MSERLYVFNVMIHHVDDEPGERRIIITEAPDARRAMDAVEAAFGAVVDIVGVNEGACLHVVFDAAPSFKPIMPTEKVVRGGRRPASIPAVRASLPTGANTAEAIQRSLNERQS